MNTFVNQFANKSIAHLKLITSIMLQICLDSVVKFEQLELVFSTKLFNDVALISKVRTFIFSTS